MQNMPEKQSYGSRFRRNVKILSTIHEQSEKTSHKRKYEDSFGERCYDVERYGQEIDNDFFKTNIGTTIRA